MKKREGEKDGGEKKWGKTPTKRLDGPIMLKSIN